MKKYDIVICGGGIAGLWLLNIFSSKGFNAILVEKNDLGGVQTLASQGMIHGGQKYLLQGLATPEALSISKMPVRWQRCFDGEGEIDLRALTILSETQVMWPAGSKISEIGLLAAAKLVSVDTQKLSPSEYPSILKKHGPVYELPEKVIDVRSLISILSAPYKDRITKGTISELSKEGVAVLNGERFEAQAIIFTAGLGNEDALTMLGENPSERAQRRPLRQIMVKTMDAPLYGHGIVNNPKPRVTITSHPLPEGGYVWYIGGGVSEKTEGMSNEEAITYTKQELQDIFPEINWSARQWSSWSGVRAEAHYQDGGLRDGPAIQEYGRILIAWPTKLTFMPALSDKISSHVSSMNLAPRYTDSITGTVPQDGKYPWETAQWS